MPSKPNGKPDNKVIHVVSLLMNPEGKQLRFTFYRDGFTKSRTFVEGHEAGSGTYLAIPIRNISHLFEGESDKDKVDLLLPDRELRIARG